MEKKKRVSWSEKEIRILRDNLDKSNEELAEKLGRSVDAVRIYRNRHRAELKKLAKQGSSLSKQVTDPADGEVLPSIRSLLAKWEISTTDYYRAKKEFSADADLLDVLNRALKIAETKQAGVGRPKVDKPKKAIKKAVKKVSVYKTIVDPYDDEILLSLAAFWAKYGITRNVWYNAIAKLKEFGADTSDVKIVYDYIKNKQSKKKKSVDTDVFNNLDLEGRFPTSKVFFDDDSTASGITVIHVQDELNGSAVDFVKVLINTKEYGQLIYTKAPDNINKTYLNTESGDKLYKIAHAVGMTRSDYTKFCLSDKVYTAIGKKLYLYGVIKDDDFKEEVGVMGCRTSPNEAFGDLFANTAKPDPIEFPITHASIAEDKICMIEQSVNQLLEKSDINPNDWKLSMIDAVGLRECIDVIESDPERRDESVRAIVEAADIIQRLYIAYGITQDEVAAARKKNLQVKFHKFAEKKGEI